jgi:NAD(P)-dependent dehydrogenase (short-subunit alcohol dehydrogenase family)
VRADPGAPDVGGARRRRAHVTTAADVLDGVDLRGRAALVTGAAGGLGLETARALAAAGAAVTAVARTRASGEKAAAAIGHPVAAEAADLADRSSVDALVDRLAAAGRRVDLVVCNAGVMACPLQRTPEGWELQFATNHLGHFLLVTGLLDRVGAERGARVVVVSSGGHVLSPVVFEDIHFERRDYDAWSAYGQSKTANALFALELARRGVTAFAVHPGMVATGLGRHLTREALRAIAQRGAAMAEPIRSVEEGAATTVFAATAAELEGQGGAYLADCRVAPEAVAPHAASPDAAARLWNASEAMLGRAD